MVQMERRKNFSSLLSVITKLSLTIQLQKSSEQGPVFIPGNVTCAMEK